MAFKKNNEWFFKENNNLYKIYSDDTNHMFLKNRASILNIISNYITLIYKWENKNIEQISTNINYRDIEDTMFIKYLFIKLLN